MVAISPPTERYTQPLDIANKACYHWGVRKVASFTDDAVQATTAADLYEDSRRYEMNREIWTFSVKRAFMRPINTPQGPATLGGTLTQSSGFTGLLTPAAWSNTATYLRGSIVSFAGIIYQAQKPVPAATEPDTNPDFWAEFFGTMAVNQWVLGGNPNNPAQWVSTQTYAQGNTVMGSDGNIYNSITNGNIGNNPTTDGGVHWQFVGAAATGPGYYAGELVYLFNGNVQSVYVSLSTGNADLPGVIPSWSTTQQYLIGNSVVSGGTTFQSAVDFNIGQTPVQPWLVGTTYAMGNEVLGTDNNLYTSVAGGNIGHNPVGDLGVHWTLVGAAAWIQQPGTQTDSMSGLNWLLLGSAKVAALQLLYPAGSGPLDQVATRNVFLLPNGYVRVAPQDPKAGSASYLGAPSGLAYNDWVFDGLFLISREVEPICLRFAADVQQVGAFNPMFCEILALRIALDGNERVTQSGEKFNEIGARYKSFGSDSRMINAIEQGPQEPPEDDYILCRL